MELMKAREMKRRIDVHDKMMGESLWVSLDEDSILYKNLRKSFDRRDKMAAEFNRLMGWRYEPGY